MIKGAVGSLILAYITLGQLKVKFYDKVYSREILDEYDFVIVGAGVSGSVIANRLSENHNITVLVIEAGPPARGDANIAIPYFAPKLPGGQYDWNYKAQKLQNAYNKVLPYPRGKVAGGSSSMNYMMYIRGTRNDFDTWESNGATGWSYDDVLPYFHRIERGLDDTLSDSVGRTGMLKLQRGYIDSGFVEFVKQSYRDIGKQWIDYFDNGGMSEGVSITTDSAFNGIRQSAADAYLFPALDERQDNLHVAFNSVVEKVLLRKEGDFKQAYGVQFERNGKMSQVRAKKDVILSAGAFNSPKILMLSGIGPRKHLNNLGIDVKMNLEGVGQNLQNHYGSPTSFYGDGYPKNLTLSENKVLRSFPKLLSDKPHVSPMTTIFGSMPVAHIYSGVNNDSSPDIQIYFPQLEVSKAMLPKQIFREEFKKARRERNGTLTHFSVVVAVVGSKSRGSVTLASNDFRDDPVIQLRYFEDPRDLQTLISGLRVVEKLETSPTFRKYNIKVVLQPFCDQDEVNNIPRSDSYYECVAKSGVGTFWHASGTCKMGNDSLSVVDNRLRVHTVTGLRVADASIMPQIVSANTQATCYMIGEKASDMMKEDWKL